MGRDFFFGLWRLESAILKEVFLDGLLGRHRVK